MSDTPTIEDVIRETAERGMSDLLIAVADYFYCLGAGIIPLPPVAPGRAELFATIECLHRIEVLEPRERLALGDEIPGWLRAYTERVAALGDAQPLEGWGAEGWPI